MKNLKFDSNLVSKILSGEKTSTWRLFDDKDLKNGDELIFIEKETGKEFAKAVIISAREKKFEDLNDEDFKGHRKYDTEKEMYEDFQKYYNLPVTPTSILKVIDFQLY